MGLKIVFTNSQITLDDSQFSVVLQNNDLTDLRDRQLTYTNQFRLPKTSKNLSVLKDVGLLGSTSTIYNENIPASIYLDDLVILENGVANILETTLDTIVFSVYTSTKNLRDRLSKLSIRDIDYSELNHVVTEEAIRSANDNPDSPYIYTNTNLQIEAETRDATYIRHQHPFIKEKWILDRILEGITIEGDIPNEDVVLAPITGLNTKVGLEGTPPSRGRGRPGTRPILVTGENFGGIGARPTVSIPSFVNDQTIPANRTFVYGINSFPETPTFDQPDIIASEPDLRLATRTIFVKVFTEAVNQAGRYVLALFDETGVEVQTRGVPAGSINGTRSLLGVTRAGDTEKGYFFFNSEETQAELLADDTITAIDIYLVFQVYGLNPFGGIRGIDQENDNETTYINVDGNNRRQGSRTRLALALTGELKYRFEVLDDLPEVNFRELLPDISQLDFFKEILWRYGLWITATGDINTFRIERLDDVLRGNLGIEDWSDHFVQEENKTYTIQFAQVNYFKYRDYENYDGYADGNFEISSGLATPNRDVITSIYEFRKPLESYLEGQTPTRFRVPIYGETSEGIVQTQNAQPTIFRISTLADKPLKIDSFQEKTVPLWDLTQNLLAWCQLVPLHYDALRQVAELNQTIKAQFNLTSQEVFNLDLFKLVHIKQLGGNFFVNEIENYTPDKVTGVELVKIPNPYEELPELKTLFEGEGTVSVSNKFVDCLLNVTISPNGTFRVNSYTTHTFNFSVSGGFGGYQIYVVYVKGATILSQSLNPETGRGSFTVNSERSFRGDNALKTIELIVNDRQGNCGKARVTLIVKDTIASLSIAGSQGYWLPPNKNHVTSGQTFIIDLKIEMPNYVTEVARGDQDVGVNILGPSNVSPSYIVEPIASENLIRLRLDNVFNVDSYEGYAFSQTIRVTTLFGTKSFTVYTLVRNLPGLNRIATSWLAPDGQSVNTDLWRVVREIPGDFNNHALSAVGVFNAVGGVPPYEFEIGNRPAEFADDGSLIYLMDFSRTSETFTNFREYQNLIQDRSQVPEPSRDFLFNAPRNDAFNKAVAIYTVPNIDRRQTQSRVLQVKVFDSSPIRISTTERVPYKYRNVRPISLRVLPEITPEEECGGVDFGENYEVFKVLPNGKTELVDRQDLTEFGLGANRIVIPLYNETHASETYRIIWEFKAGKPFYTGNASIRDLAVVGDETFVGPPRESGIEIIRPDPSLEASVTISGTTLTANFRTRASHESSTVDPYWQQAVRIFLGDNCYTQNRKILIVPIFIQNTRNDKDCPPLTVSEILGFGYSAGDPQNVTVRTLSPYNTRILEDPNGIFTLGGETSPPGLDPLSDRIVTVVANDVPARYNTTGAPREIRAILEVFTSCNTKRILLSALEFTAGQACLTVPSLSIGAGDLCTTLNPAPDIVGDTATLSRGEHRLIWNVNVSPSSADFPFLVLAEGATLETIDGAQTDATELFEVSTGVLVVKANASNLRRQIYLRLRYSDRQGSVAVFSLNFNQRGGASGEVDVVINQKPEGVIAKTGGNVELTLTPSPIEDATFLQKFAVPIANWATLNKLRQNVWRLTAVANDTPQARRVVLLYSSDSVEARQFVVQQEAGDEPPGDFRLKFIRFESEGGDQPAPPVDPCEGVPPTLEVSPGSRPVPASIAVGSITTNFSFSVACEKGDLALSWDFGDFDAFASAEVNASNETIDVLVQQNNNNRPRSATLTVSATNDTGTTSVTVSLVQSARLVPDVRIAPLKTATLSATNAVAMFTYELINAVLDDATITQKPDFATQTKFSDGELNFDLTDNPTFETREGAVTIRVSNRLGFATATATIVQEGRVRPPKAPTVAFSDTDDADLGYTAGSIVSVPFTLTDATLNDLSASFSDPWFSSTQEASGSGFVAKIRAVQTNQADQTRSGVLTFTVTTPAGTDSDTKNVVQAKNPTILPAPDITFDNNVANVSYDGTEDAVFVFALENVSPLNVAFSDLADWITAGTITATGSKFTTAFDVARNTGSARSDDIDVTVTAGDQQATDVIRINQTASPPAPTINITAQLFTVTATDTARATTFLITGGTIDQVSIAPTGPIIRTATISAGATANLGRIDFVINANTNTQARTETVTATITNEFGSGSDTVEFDQLGLVLRAPTIRFPDGNIVQVMDVGLEARVRYILTNATRDDLTLGTTPDWITNFKIVDDGILGFTVAGNQNTQEREAQLKVTVTTAGGSDSGTIEVTQAGMTVAPILAPTITIGGADVSVDADGSEDYTNTYALSNATEDDLVGFVDTDFMPITTFPDWFEVAPTYGEGKITVNVIANRSFQARSYRMGLKVETVGGSDFGFFSVLQDPVLAPDCTITFVGNMRDRVGLSGGTFVRRFNSRNVPSARNSSFTFSSSETWVTSNLINVDNIRGGRRVFINVARNNTGEERTAVLKISSANANGKACSAEFTLTQVALALPPPTIRISSRPYQLDWNADSMEFLVPYAITNAHFDDVNVIDAPSGFVYGINDTRIRVFFTTENPDTSIRRFFVTVQVKTPEGSDTARINFVQEARPPRPTIAITNKRSIGRLPGGVLSSVITENSKYIIDYTITNATFNDVTASIAPQRPVAFTVRDGEVEMRFTATSVNDRRTRTFGTVTLTVSTEAGTVSDTVVLRQASRFDLDSASASPSPSTSPETSMLPSPPPPAGRFLFANGTRNDSWNISKWNLGTTFEDFVALFDLVGLTVNDIVISDFEDGTEYNSDGYLEQDLIIETGDKSVPNESIDFRVRGNNYRYDAGATILVEFTYPNVLPLSGRFIWPARPAYGVPPTIDVQVVSSARVNENVQISVTVTNATLGDVYFDPLLLSADRFQDINWGGEKRDGKLYVGVSDRVEVTTTIVVLFERSFAYTLRAYVHNDSGSAFQTFSIIVTGMDVSRSASLSESSSATPSLSESNTPTPSPSMLPTPAPRNTKFLFADGSRTAIFNLSRWDAGTTYQDFVALLDLENIELSDITIDYTEANDGPTFDTEGYLTDDATVEDDIRNVANSSIRFRAKGNNLSFNARLTIGAFLNVENETPLSVQFVWPQRPDEEDQPTISISHTEAIGINTGTSFFVTVTNAVLGDVIFSLPDDQIGHVNFGGILANGDYYVQDRIKTDTSATIELLFDKAGVYNITANVANNQGEDVETFNFLVTGVGTKVMLFEGNKSTETFDVSRWDLGTNIERFVANLELVGLDVNDISLAYVNNEVSIVDNHLQQDANVELASRDVAGETLTFRTTGNNFRFDDTATVQVRLSATGVAPITANFVWPGREDFAQPPQLLIAPPNPVIMDFGHNIGLETINAVLGDLTIEIISGDRNDVNLGADFINGKYYVQRVHRNQLATIMTAVFSKVGPYTLRFTVTTDTDPAFQRDVTFSVMAASPTPSPSMTESMSATPSPSPSPQSTFFSIDGSGRRLRFKRTADGTLVEGETLNTAQDFEYTFTSNGVNLSRVSATATITTRDGTVDAPSGTLTNFRIDGDKVKFKLKYLNCFLFQSHYILVAIEAGVGYLTYLNIEVEPTSRFEDRAQLLLRDPLPTQRGASVELQFTEDDTRGARKKVSFLLTNFHTECLPKEQRLDGVGENVFGSDTAPSGGVGGTVAIFTSKPQGLSSSGFGLYSLSNVDFSGGGGGGGGGTLVQDFSNPPPSVFRAVNNGINLGVWLTGLSTYTILDIDFQYNESTGILDVWFERRTNGLSSSLLSVWVASATGGDGVKRDSTFEYWTSWFIRVRQDPARVIDIQSNFTFKATERQGTTRKITFRLPQGQDGTNIRVETDGTGVSAIGITRSDVGTGNWDLEIERNTNAAFTNVIFLRLTGLPVARVDIIGIAVT